MRLLVTESRMKPYVRPGLWIMVEQSRVIWCTKARRVLKIVERLTGVVGKTQGTLCVAGSNPSSYPVTLLPLAHTPGSGSMRARVEAYFRAAKIGMWNSFKVFHRPVRRCCRCRDSAAA